MTIKEQMERIYGEMPPDKIPWHTAAPPPILEKAMEANARGGSKVVEFGCGAGNHVIYFARKGFDVTGVDFSENAIALARRAASSAGVNCRFIVADVRGRLRELDEPFDFAFDWELLHHIFPESRDGYLRNVARVLDPAGRYLSVCFSEDSPQFGGAGKYRRTPLDTILYFSAEEELRSLFGRHFVVEDLGTIDIEGRNAVHKAIYAFMRKRPRRARS